MTSASNEGRKRVLHVSSAHRASDGRISRKEAASLAAAGYEVTVLALVRAKNVQFHGDFKVVEYGRPSSRTYRFLIRLPWLASFCLRRRYDVYHLHDPELILLGFVLRLCGRRVIYDAHEAYPMVILDREWIPSLIKPLLSSVWWRIESAFVRHADLTVAAHETVRDQFKEGPVVVVRNFPIVSDLNLESATPMAERPARIIYHGDLTRQRGLFSMVEAMDNVADANLHIAGSLTPFDEREMGRFDGARRTRYLGWLDGPALALELDHARAGLALLHPTNNYLKIRPNKLYEYMAAGLPVIASNFSHWRPIVEENQCGILVDPLDPTAIAEAINRILEHPDEATEMGRRGRAAVESQFNWQQEHTKLVCAYDRLWSENSDR